MRATYEYDPCTVVHDLGPHDPVQVLLHDAQAPAALLGDPLNKWETDGCEKDIRQI